MKADFIFIIKPNKLVRDFRVTWRFIKTRMGIEEWNYKQSLKNLYQMLFINIQEHLSAKTGRHLTSHYNG
ncbi:hypothetical protein SAMN04487897_12260 [Paenibacillus sp. yr247]|nr:hypothetical protein SAMN04487897_12260 [Paenibacillus sp. yr247]